MSTRPLPTPAQPPRRLPAPPLPASTASAATAAAAIKQQQQRALPAQPQARPQVQARLPQAQALLRSQQQLQPQVQARLSQQPLQPQALQQQQQQQAQAKAPQPQQPPSLQSPTRQSQSHAQIQQSRRPQLPRSQLQAHPQQSHSPPQQPQRSQPQPQPQPQAQPQSRLKLQPRPQSQPQPRPQPRPLPLPSAAAQAPSASGGARRLPAAPTKLTRDMAARRIQRLVRRAKLRAEIARRIDRRKTRSNIVHEILSTEKDYVDHLREITETFMVPLEQTHALSAEELALLFPRVQQINEIHIELLHHLEERVGAWGAQSRIADVFSAFLNDGKLFVAYRDYITRHPDTQCALGLFFETKRAFRTHVERQKSKMGTGKFYLESLLICIVQRLPRYALFFRDLKKCTLTEDEKEHVTIDQVLYALNNLTGLLNLQAGEEDQLKHKWKVRHFKLPKHCDACDQFIVVMQQGCECEQCNTVTHLECQFNAPACSVAVAAPVEVPAAVATVVAPATAPAPGVDPVAVPRKVVAKFDCEAETPDDLAFKVGDVIMVTQQFPDNWWQGECHGHVGLFPSNYVSELAS
eukprot:TRINITY_DN3139_c0_g1_i1.p1 TRINITY_DN3139_c0_g1~~TRINITY_DN3139_c0_g1_i1.p1  ORF type:complete len:579 (-),score=186.69 TRINITY_DN3139_c0_g1_i1:57-1793(-)